MIRLLPYESETLVVTHGWDIVLKKLSDGLQEQPTRGRHHLTGWVRDDRFQVTLVTRRYNSFMPVATGRIDPTSGGCLIFLDYRLFPATRIYLIFWSLFLLLAGVFASYQYKNLLLWTASLAVIVLVNLVAWANFRLHLKTTRATLLRLLE